MKSLPWILAAAAALLAAAPATGGEIRQQPKAVLELFTSQGCNSCPDADALLISLSQRKDLITLAYHVDYWDYIGWKDTFGAAANSERQRDYVKAWGSSRIFTPQLVVNGRSGVVGSNQKDVTGAINGAARLSVPVALELGGDMLEVSVGGKPGGREAVIWIVTYTDKAAVQISRGENAGKTVDYTSIVTGKQVLGMWEPENGSHFRLPLAELMEGGSNGAVILVQEERDGLPGPIVGAASVQL
ncbi:MAG: DUF1223 domain-containing protein [Devosia sp.]